MGPADKLVEVDCNLVIREITLGQGQIRTGATVKLASFFDLIGRESLYAGLATIDQIAQAFPGGLSRFVKFVRLHMVLIVDHFASNVK